MNTLIRMFLTAAIVNLCVWNAYADEPQPPVDQQALENWQDMKFGMFIHWGLFSKTAGYWKGRRAKSSGHIMLYEKISVKEWGELAKDFNPVKFDADAWVLAAKNAGMKYLVITTKHHDGLAMYDSPSSDYDLVDKSPFKRDPLKELADACHKHGVMLGFYYSLGRDWEDPDCPTNWPEKGGRSNTWDYPDEDAKVITKYFNRKAKPQVLELVTRYGDVGIMWFDTPDLMPKEPSMELRRLILANQPKCIINNRIGNGQGDYEVREQKIGDISREPWESCVTMSRQWNYDLDEKDEYKSAELMVNQLIQVVSKGGNYLLNIGPRADGTITEQALERLDAIGKWMAVNGEGVYGTQPWTIDHEKLRASSVPETAGESRGAKNSTEGKDAVNDATSKIVLSEVRFTTKGNSLYAFISKWDQTSVLIKSLTPQTLAITDVQLLGFNGDIEWTQSEQGLTLEIPSYEGTGNVPIICFKIM